MEIIEYFRSESDIKTMIIFMGIQACGKTTFYNTFLKDSYAHISLDVLNTRNKERLALEKCFEEELCFVVDNTNPTRADRERYIPKAKENGYKVIGCYFKSSISESVARNDGRQGKAKVPRCAIAATYNKLELPDYDEGFDELYYISIEEDGMVVKEWAEDEI